MLINLFKNNKLFTATSIFLLFFYIFIAFSGFLLMNHISHNNHDIHSSIGIDCPYIESGSSVCPLNLFNNLSLIKNTSLTILNTIVFILLFIFSFTFYKILVNLKILKLILYQKKVYLKEIFILYISLFRKGILNPKVF